LLQAERDTEKIKRLEGLLAAESKKVGQMQKQLRQVEHEKQQQNEMFARLQSEGQQDLSEERSQWQQLQDGYMTQIQHLGAENALFVQEGACLSSPASAHPPSGP
jgi:predicted nuclease with TOPRIM domain